MQNFNSIRILCKATLMQCRQMWIIFMNICKPVLTMWREVFRQLKVTLILLKILLSNFLHNYSRTFLYMVELIPKLFFQTLRKQSLKSKNFKPLLKKQITIKTMLSNKTNVLKKVKFVKLVFLLRDIKLKYLQFSNTIRIYRW